MNSSFKALFHTLATLVAFWLPTIASNSHALDATVGSVIALGLNWLLSHTVPTTSGASAEQ